MKKIFKLNPAALFLALFSFVACGDNNKEKVGGNPGSETPLTSDVTVFVTTNTRSQDFKKQSASFSKKT